MKEINNNNIEKALTMHKETVSPHPNCLQEILSQIPERKIVTGRRAVRSPYTWLAITQVITLSCMLIIVIPAMITLSNDDFLSYNLETSVIDSQVEKFELNIDAQDYQMSLNDSLLL